MKIISMMMRNKNNLVREQKQDQRGYREQKALLANKNYVYDNSSGTGIEGLKTVWSYLIGCCIWYSELFDSNTTKGTLQRHSQLQC